MALGELLDQIRDEYVSRLAATIAKLRAPPGATVHPEAALRDSSGALVREGHFALPYRVDAAVEHDGQVIDTVMVDTDHVLSFETITFEWSGGLQVALNPFVWDSCHVIVPEPMDTRLVAWFSKWFDEDDVLPVMPNGTIGVVHFMSDPEQHGTSWSLQVDFGSAPVQAFEELLDAINAAGQTHVEIGRMRTN